MAKACTPKTASSGIQNGALTTIPSSTRTAYRRLGCRTKSATRPRPSQTQRTAMTVTFPCRTAHRHRHQATTTTTAVMTTAVMTIHHSIYPFQKGLRVSLLSPWTHNTCTHSSRNGRSAERGTTRPEELPTAAPLRSSTAHDPRTASTGAHRLRRAARAHVHYFCPARSTITRHDRRAARTDPDDAETASCSAGTRTADHLCRTCPARPQERSDSLCPARAQAQEVVSRSLSFRSWRIE